MAVTEYREDVLTQRQKGIGGTDISAIVGLNPWRSPLDVYLGKLGLTELQEPTEGMWWGNYLEDGIRRRYGQVTNSRIVHPLEFKHCFNNCLGDWQGGSLLKHLKHDFVLGSPDGLASEVISQDGMKIGLTRGLEVKNSGWKSQEWGTPGTDEIPKHYLLQCAWYMAITDLPSWDLAVLFSGNRMEIYTVHRDVELERTIIAAGEEFWKKHVLAKVPPPIDSSVSWKRHLSKQFADGNDTILEPTTEHLLQLSLLHKAKSRIAEAKELETRSNSMLMAAIGKNKGIAGDFGKITWVRPKPGKTTDWEAVAKDLNPPAELIKKHTKPTRKAAYLLATFKDDKAVES